MRHFYNYPPMYHHPNQLPMPYSGSYSDPTMITQSVKHTFSNGNIANIEFRRDLKTDKEFIFITTPRKGFSCVGVVMICDNGDTASQACDSSQPIYRDSKNCTIACTGC